MSFYNRLALALGLNFFLRSITFLLTLYLTRILLPSQSGVGFIYAIYVDLVVFIAREAIRSVAYRINLRPLKHASESSSPTREGCKYSGNIPKIEDGASFSSKSIHQVVNLSALSAPLAFLIVVILEVGALVTGQHVLPSLWANVRGPISSEPLVQHYQVYESRFHAFAIQCIIPILPELVSWFSTIIRPLSEPCIALVHALDMMHIVVIAEFSSIAGRLVTTIALVHFYGLHSSWSTRMIFALGQLVCSVVNISYYGLLCAGRPFISRWLCGSTTLDELRAVSLSKGAPQEWWRAIIPFPWCHIEFRKMAYECTTQFYLLRSFFLESLLRVSLSGGESFALNAMGTAADQGIYQLIINLGTMVVRLVFHVWESSCFVRWSQDAARGQIGLAVDLLCVMLRFAFYLGFSFTLLGSQAAPFILKTLYSSHWTSASAILSLKCYLCSLPLTALLGLLEAFLRAVASPAMLSRLQRVMAASSLLYIVLCYALLRYCAKQSDKLGNDGVDSRESNAVVYLIAANIANTGYRLCCVFYLLTCIDAKMRSTCKKVSDTHGSSLLSSGDNEANGDSSNSLGLNPEVDGETGHGAILTIEILKKASISPYLMGYLVLLLAYSAFTPFSFPKVVLTGIFYGLGILYWDDTILSFVRNTLSSRLAHSKTKM